MTASAWHVRANRALVGVLAVALLWCTSLSACTGIMSALLTAPTYEEVRVLAVGRCRFTLA